MKVKDYDFKYNDIEMITSSLDGTRLGKMALLPIGAFKRDFGYMEVLSVKNYEDTKTTSVIVHSEGLD